MLRTARESPTRSNEAEMDELPQDIRDQIAAMEAQDAGNQRFSNEDSTSTSNVRVCPHCTFENSHSGSDCEVCGLPLS